MCLINQIPFCLLLINCFRDSMVNNPFSYIPNHFVAQPGFLMKVCVLKNQLHAETV